MHVRAHAPLGQVRAERIALIALYHEEMEDTATRWRPKSARQPRQVTLREAHSRRIPRLEMPEFDAQHGGLDLVQARDGAVELADVFLPPAVHAQQSRALGHAAVGREQCA